MSKVLKEHTHHIPATTLVVYVVQHAPEADHPFTVAVFDANEQVDNYLCPDLATALSDRNTAISEFTARGRG